MFFSLSNSPPSVYITKFTPKKAGRFDRPDKVLLNVILRNDPCGLNDLGQVRLYQGVGGEHNLGSRVKVFNVFSQAFLPSYVK